MANTVKFLLLVALTVVPSIGSAESNAGRVLLVLAANDGDDREQSLRWAQADAQAFARVMLEIGQVPAENLVTLLGADATDARNAFDRVSERLEALQASRPSPELIVYIASHADPQNLHLSGDRVPLAELRNWFESTPARARLLILDTCFGGGVWERSGAGGVRTVVRTPAPEGTFYLSASAANEVAQESDELGGGYFSTHLMSGLRGAADTDADGRVTLSEVFAHTYNRTLQDSFSTAPSTQHPQYSSNAQGETDLVLSTLGQASAQLRVPHAFSGHLLVVDDRSGRVRIDAFHTRSDVDVNYALPPGSYRLITRNRDGVRAGEVVLGPQAKTSMPELRAVEPARFSAVARGRDYDPSPIDLRLRFGTSWQWNRRAESDAGLLALVLGVDIEFYRQGYLSPGLRYARTLGGNGTWLGSLDILTATIEGGYQHEVGAGALRFGANAYGGWIRQRVTSAQTSDAATWGVGPIVGYGHEWGAWRFGLALFAGATGVRQDFETDWDATARIDFSVDYRLF